MQVSTHNNHAQSVTPPGFERRATWPQTGPGDSLYELCETTTTVTRTITGPFPHLPGSQPFNPSTQQYQAHPCVTQQRQYAAIPVRPESSTLAYTQTLPAPHQPTTPDNSCGPAPIPGFFVEGEQKQKQEQNPMAVFGGDFVADVMEVFYIREKPVVCQPGDGVIKIPGPAAMQFKDGFKVDVTGSGMTEQRVLRDLPSRDVICCQRKKVHLLSCLYPASLSLLTNLLWSCRKLLSVQP